MVAMGISAKYRHPSDREQKPANRPVNMETASEMAAQSVPPAMRRAKVGSAGGLSCHGHFSQGINIVNNRAVAKQYS